MTEQELYEVFYSVIAHGNGKQIAEFFNQQFEKAKGDREQLLFLYNALSKYVLYNMVFEHKDIFKHLRGIVGEELQKM